MTLCSIVILSCKYVFVDVMCTNIATFTTFDSKFIVIGSPLTEIRIYLCIFKLSIITNPHCLSTNTARPI